MNVQPSGYFVLNKQIGVSSAQQLAQLRKKLAIEKIGHSGTLDPFASGILIAMVNRATRFACFLSHGGKCYRAGIRFGIATDTDDTTGAIIERSAVRPSLEQVRDIIAHSFIGDIVQRPPQVSAVKINGKRAYARARNGEVFETSERVVKVLSIDILSFIGDLLELRIRCGSGTYIRSLARDLGKAVGSCATTESLCREQSDPFSLTDSHTVESITWEHLHPWDSIFTIFPRVYVPEAALHAILRGDLRPFATGVLKQQLILLAQEPYCVLCREADKVSVALLQCVHGRWSLFATGGVI